MMNNSPQNGGQGPSAPNQPPEMYGTRTGAANQDGTDFEIKMCALVFLRAVQSYSSFKMTSNDPRAGAFDDIVLSYGSPGDKQNILVQLKTSIKPINFVRKRNKSLKDYFQSLKISNSSEYFKNCTYVFYTNANVDLNLSVANADSPSKKLLCTTWKPDNVLHIHLTDDICDEFRDETLAEDFVNRLLIFRNQCGPEYLDELIKQELIKMCHGFVTVCRTIQNNFVEKIKAWWRKRTKAPLDENWEEWTQLEAQLLGQNTLLKQIKFCEDTLSHLEKTVLDSKSDIILLKSDSAEAQIVCSKVYQTFINSKTLQVLFTDLSEPQDMLFNLWSKDECDVLVITDVTNCSENLADNIANYKGNAEKQNKKKIVIVSSRGADKLGLSQVDEFGADFTKSTFKQLDENSQHRLRNLEVCFQGKRITLGKIMTHKILGKVPLQDVLSSPKIEIGTALPACNGKYIPRTMSKRILVPEVFLFLNKHDVFFIGSADSYSCSRMLEDKIGRTRFANRLKPYEPPGRRLGCRFNFMTRRELYERISGFKCCAEILAEGRVHFLEECEHSLYWIHSHGSTDDHFEYCMEYISQEVETIEMLIRDAKTRLVKEDDLVRKEFRKVIVADEPGTGKTALLLEVANKMKELNPHRLIFHIDLNKHSGILTEMKQAGNVTRENVLRLLSKAANLDDSELGKQLLKYYVSESGDICILFDAFDEIAPSYTDTVLAILKLILREFKLSILWIASRYNMKETLEEELKSKVFRIEPLSDEEQIDFMSKFWGREKAKEFHKTIIDKLPFGVRSSPLHLKMMCEIYPDIDLSDNFSRMSTPFDVVKLYEQFIEKKFDIYIKEKCHLNCPSAVIETIKKNERGRFMKRHMICSLRVLNLDVYAHEHLRSSIQDKVSKLCKNIEEGNERLGIIDGVVGSIPHFIHRTFAEHFAAKWLAEHWEENREIIYSVFTEREFRYVNKILSLELDRELPAHLAVLNEDISALKGLKKEDLNKTDVLGRTPLHLAVMMEGGNAFNVQLELLKYGPDLHMCDVLGHTPLYYARKMWKEDVESIL